MTIPLTSPDFQRAVLACRYFFGVRGAELAATFAEPTAEAEHLLQQLASPERADRAGALAAELARLGREVMARRVGA